MYRAPIVELKTVDLKYVHKMLKTSKYREVSYANSIVAGRKCMGLIKSKQLIK
jgi:hypothetical protein